MTDFVKIKGVQEIFRKITVRELMNKKNVQDFNKIKKKLRIPRLEKIGFEGDLGAGQKQQSTWRNKIVLKN